MNQILRHYARQRENPITLLGAGTLTYAEGLNVTSTLVLRFVGASVILWGWLIGRRSWQIPRRDAIAALSLGLFGYAGQALFLFSAFQYAGAGMATLLLYTHPAIICLLAWLLEKKRPTPRRIAALSLALLGCLLIANLQSESTSLTGILFGLASGLWYAVYLFCCARLLNAISPLVSTAYISLGAAISFVGAAIANTNFILPTTPTAVLLALSLVVVSTIVPVLSLFAGMQILGVSQASILSTVEPLIAVILGITFLGEKLSHLQMLGGLLIVGSVILIRLRSSEQGV